MDIDTRATHGSAYEIDAGNGGMVIQNQGPGKVAWSRNANVDVVTGPGIVLEVGDAYEVLPGNPVTLWVTSDTDNTDLRVEAV